MRYLLLLCAAFVSAENYCTVTSGSSFTSDRDDNLEIYEIFHFPGISTPSKSKVGHEGKLKPSSSWTTSRISTQSEVKCIENGSIVREFEATSNKTGETFKIKETVKLDGCNVSSVEVDATPGVEFSITSICGSSSTVEYKFRK